MMITININAMLDRIQLLMKGIQNVSDNIAHDLRTPLTHLRNRLETLPKDTGNRSLSIKQMVLEDTDRIFH